VWDLCDVRTPFLPQCQERVLERLAQALEASTKVRRRSR